MYYRGFSCEYLKYFVAFIILTGLGNLIGRKCSVPGFVGCLSLKQHPKEKEKIKYHVWDLKKKKVKSLEMVKG